jgi:glycerate kinase
MPVPATATAPRRVLIAPNAFKGTLSGRQAALAIGEGVALSWPSTNCRSMPLSDGGDGFMETLLAVPGSSDFPVQVVGPLQEAVWSRVGWLGGDVKGVAVVELAGACGLSLVHHPSPDTSMRASTKGLGELIAAALERGARKLLIGLGGSASTDGGAGLAQALGFRLLDRSGEPIRPGGLGLTDLDRIETPDTLAWSGQAQLVAACDVESPLLGRLGAAAVFGPQKGADPATVRLLERGLERLAMVVERDLHPPVLDSTPGMGAAGGTAFGLAAFGGARLESGASLVASCVGLDQALGETDLVITGEGRFDQASLTGKVTGELLRRCAGLQLRCLVLAGSADPAAAQSARKLGGQVVVTSSGSVSAHALNTERALSELRLATQRACREWAASGPSESA